jgi:hypothetical protein
MRLLSLSRPGLASIRVSHVDSQGQVSNDMVDERREAGIAVLYELQFCSSRSHA